MYGRTSTMTSTINYSEKIKALKSALNTADAVVIGTVLNDITGEG